MKISHPTASIGLKADSVTLGNVTLAVSLNTGSQNVDLLGMTINGGLQTVQGQTVIGSTTVVSGTNSEGTPTGSPPQVQTLAFYTNWSPSRQ